MGYEECEGMFVSVSYTTKDGANKFAKGRLGKVEDGNILHIYHTQDSRIYYMIDISQVKVTSFSAEPLKEVGTQ